MTFSLHDRLAADTFELVRWSLSLVLLMNARQWPWLILVPMRPRLREIHDLGAADRTTLIEEAARASRTLQRLFRPDKVNVGALGNLVPQLHLHVGARFRNDPAWPKPVWGLRPVPYGPEELAGRIAELRRVLGGAPPPALP
jgi:diadenosine tetraphosphate (Ap4A) HIT family hydrolase